VLDLAPSDAQRDIIIELANQGDRLVDVDRLQSQPELVAAA